MKIGHLFWNEMYTTWKKISIHEQMLKNKDVATHAKVKSDQATMVTSKSIASDNLQQRCIEQGSSKGAGDPKGKR